MINLFFVIHDYSGARTYADELLKFLSTFNNLILHKVFFESTYYTEYTIIRDEKITEIHLPPSRKNDRSLTKYSIRCLDLMQSNLEGKKNIIFHLNADNHVKLGIEARKRFAAKIIYTRHFLPDFFSYFGYDDNWQGDPKNIGDVLEREMANEADRIICVTRFAKEAISRFYDIPFKKIVAIHNGFSTLTNEPDTSEKPVKIIKKSFTLNQNDKIILFVGLLEHRKGINPLIRAFSLILDSFPKARLIIAGDGDFKNALSQIKGCWSKISFTGKISYDELKKFYRIATVGIIPSIYEQCSYVALEMMKNGLPVVVSNAPGLRELYEDGENAIVVPLQKDEDKQTLTLNEEEFAKSLAKVLNNKQLLTNIRKNTRKKWEQFYTVERMGKDTLKEYKLILLDF